ncbi:hypothetical protein [Roseateles chitinivorans]
MNRIKTDLKVRAGRAPIAVALIGLMGAFAPIAHAVTLPRHRSRRRQ